MAFLLLASAKAGFQSKCILPFCITLSHAITVSTGTLFQSHPSVCDAVVSVSGLSEGSLKFIITVLATYPLASLGSLLPRGTARHLMDIVVGSLVLMFVFGGAWIYVPLSAALTWMALVAMQPSASSVAPSTASLGSTPWWHMAACCVSFFFLFFRHVMRQNAVMDSIDDCAAQMVLVVKLTSMAFAVYDGSKTEREAAIAAGAAVKSSKAAIGAAKEALKTTPKDPELIKRLVKEEKIGRDASRTARTAALRLSACLPSVPSFIETMGYSLCPQTALVGPSF